MKKLFGPFPDEPLLYGFDKILGLFNKFDSKLKRDNAASNAATNSVASVEPADEKIDDVVGNETTTEMVVTSTQRVS